MKNLSFSVVSPEDNSSKSGPSAAEKPGFAAENAKIDNPTGENPVGSVLRSAAKPAKKKKISRCDDCEFFETDEFGDTYCSMSLDEDEMAEFLAHETGRCPYYRYYDEYKSVRKQN